MFRIMGMLFLLGICLGIIGTYEFIMLTELNAAVDFMGFCRLVGVLLELPVWYYSISLMDRIGIQNCQTMCLFFCSLRLFWYGIMVTATQALYVEVLHGFSFALPYASITVFIARVAPEETKSTLQSCILVLFGGLGTGTGAIIGGIMIDYFLGERIQLLFRLCGM